MARPWIALAFVLAAGGCAPADGRVAEASTFENREIAVETECRMPATPTTLRAERGAILETWDVPLDDVLTDDLPGEAAFVDYRAAIERDGADLRRPVRDPPVIRSEAAAAVWENEFYNNDLVFDEGVGTVDPVTCLDALLLTRQAIRVSQLRKPTEFVASVLHREVVDGGTRLLVVFGAGSNVFVPQGWYGIEEVEEYLTEGWDLGYVIHNHTTQRYEGGLALGAPVPSTNDVELTRALGVRLGLDSVRVTNGFYTFRASIDDLSRFRAR